MKTNCRFLAAGKPLFPIALALGGIVSGTASEGCEWVYPSISLEADGGAAAVSSSDGGALSQGGSSGGGQNGSSGATIGTGSGNGGGSGGASSSGAGESSSGSSGGEIGGSSGAGSSGGASSGSSGSGGGAGSSSGSVGVGSSSGGSSSGGTAPAISFVQASSQDTKSGSVASISAPYTDAQSAGDLNVVVIGWGNPSNTINSVSDSAGNTYTAARAVASNTGAVVAIYFAKDIAASSSNTVTVSLDANDVLCVAILEYAGVSAIDQTGEGSGMGQTASTNTVSTSASNELVLGAGEPDQTEDADFSSVGSGFNERVITGTSGMLVEDMIVSQTGSFTASGGLTKSTPWVMEIVSFR